MICVIGEYKNKFARYLGKHFNKCRLLFKTFLFAAYARMGIKDALIFNFCIVGDSDFNKYYLFAILVI
jgi:hypothetical protein